MVLAFAHQKGLEIKADVSPADFGDSLSPADVAGPSRTDQPLPGPVDWHSMSLCTVMGPKRI